MIRQAIEFSRVSIHHFSRVHPLGITLHILLGIVKYEKPATFKFRHCIVNAGMSHLSIDQGKIETLIRVVIHNVGICNLLVCYFGGGYLSANGNNR